MYMVERQEGENSVETIIKTLCGLCHKNREMDGVVKNGLIEKIKGNPDHHVNRGTL
jgi:anaerobic selenocysteine-containing dehydrogenase